MEQLEKIHGYLRPVRNFLRRACFHWDKGVVILLVYCLAAGGFWAFQRQTSVEELQHRRQLASAAESFLGCREDDGSYMTILDRYNAQELLPRGYTVTPEDSWCAVFGTVASIEAGMADLVPPECSCGQQIDRFKELGRWVESDWYLPRVGDYIFYDWDNTSSRDSTGWPDHVGIVTETFGPVIKVIEGNKDDMVTYRYVFLDDLWIRGYGLPEYSR